MRVRNHVNICKAWVFITTPGTDINSVLNSGTLKCKGKLIHVPN